MWAESCTYWTDLMDSVAGMKQVLASLARDTAAAAAEGEDQEEEDSDAEPEVLVPGSAAKVGCRW